MCITTDGGLSIEMERVLNNLPGAEKVDSKRILEINPNHKVFAALCALDNAGEEDTLSLYARVLYNQALIIEGLIPEDAVAYCDDVSRLMNKADAANNTVPADNAVPVTESDADGKQN